MSRYGEEQCRLLVGEWIHLSHDIRQLNHEGLDKSRQHAQS